MAGSALKALTVAGLVAAIAFAPTAAGAQVAEPPASSPPTTAPSTSDLPATDPAPAVEDPAAAAPSTTLPPVDATDPGEGDVASAPPSEVAPANDAFADAEVVSGSTGSVSGSTIDATNETGEPDHSGVDIEPGGSVWYTWTAPATESIAFDTCDSTFDSLLGVYTGTAVDGLTTVVQDDDGCGAALGGIAVFDATAGTTYAIAVDGFGGQQGEFTLAWGPPPPPPAPPANDQFADAQVISGLSGEVNGTNVGATKEAGEPDHADVPGGASVWYAWTSPAGGQAVFDTCTADYDTLLGVYTGTSLDDLELVAGNDDDCASGDFPTLQSSVAFAATAGTTYWIAVDGFGFEPQLPVQTGTFTLAWDLDVAPPPPPPPPPGPDVPELARTGTDALPATLVGVVLLGLGAALVLVSRRIRAAR